MFIMINFPLPVVLWDKKLISLELSKFLTINWFNPLMPGGSRKIIRT